MWQELVFLLIACGIVFGVTYLIRCGVLKQQPEHSRQKKPKTRAQRRQAERQAARPKTSIRSAI